MYVEYGSPVVDLTSITCIGQLGYVEDDLVKWL